MMVVVAPCNVLKQWSCKISIVFIVAFQSSCSKCLLYKSLLDALCVHNLSCIFVLLNIFARIINYCFA